MCLILWIGTLAFGVFGLLKMKLPILSSKYFDLLVVACLLVGAMVFWMEPPSPHNEFTMKLTAPYFQPFPSSDAAVNDLGGLSILKGSGILFGSYTDKPLYMVFLACLHLLGGYDYNLLTILYAGFMALMLPGLYFLGKSFHSRLFGFILAGSEMFRQYNAISLSNFLYFNATPRQLLTEVPTLVGLIFFTWALFLWIRSKQNDGWRALLVGGSLGAVTLIRLNPFLLVLAVPVFLFFSRAGQKKAWLAQSVIFLLGCTIVIAPWVLTGRDPDGKPYFLVKFFDVIHVRYGPNGALPIENGFSFASQVVPSGNGAGLTALSAGFDLPPLSIETFPGFVLNHTLNNFVGAFLSLPDSILTADQNLTILTMRPYWVSGIELIAPQQIPFLLLNLVFLALGLGWGWKRWKWAGLAPLFVFAVYALSLGFGRTAGSRHLVPIDWVVHFYFALGLVWLFELLPGDFRRMLEAEPVKAYVNLTRLATKWQRFGAVCAVLCMGVPIFAAQKLVAPQAPFCQPGSLESQAAALKKQGAPDQISLVYGVVLYPRVEKDQLSFLLLTCHGYPYFEIKGFRERLAVGQQILAGISNTGNNQELMLLADTAGEEPHIIWQRP